MTTPQPTTPAQLLSAAVVYGSNPPVRLPIGSAPAAEPVAKDNEAERAA